MPNRTITYHLKIHQLHQPYSSQEDLQHSTPLQSYEADSPFATFHVGETVSDGASLTYLGRVQHIHHMVGETSSGEVIHVVSLYLEPDDGQAE